MDVQTFPVEDDLADKRADLVIAAAMPQITRSFAQKLIAGGSVSVNGTVVTKVSTKLSCGDIVTVSLPDPEPLIIMPEDIPLDILYEDADLLIVNKPKGMVVHPAPGHTVGTLVNALLYHCGGQLSGINGVARPGIVHRIDRDTTGLLVVCKNDRAHLALSRQLAEHSITRRYDCICEGIVTADGTVDAPIGRSQKDRKKMGIVPDGRRAVTHYHVVEPLGKKYTYLQCRLETGRTHQIRVHMSSIHHPLLGDTVYGREKQPFNTQGQVLHAGLLGFVHPATGEYMEFEAPLPQYFSDLLDKLRR